MIARRRESKPTKVTLQAKSERVTPSSTIEDDRGDLSIFDFEILLDGEPLRSVKKVEIIIDAGQALPKLRLTCFDRCIDAVLEDFEGLTIPAEVEVELLRLGPRGEKYSRVST